MNPVSQVKKTHSFIFIDNDVLLFFNIVIHRTLIALSCSSTSRPLYEVKVLSVFITLIDISILLKKWWNKIAIDFRV